MQIERQSIHNLAERNRPLRSWIAASFAAMGVVGLLVLTVGDSPRFAFSDDAGQKPKPATTQPGADSKPGPPAAKVAFKTHVQPFLRKYCFDCHGEKRQRGEIAFHSFQDETSVLKGRDTWERALEMLESGMMPPKKSPRPAPAELQRITAWIESTLFDVDCTLADNRDPGRVTIRRLNRAEYNNTIRDLVGVNFNPADDFPSDDVGYGFDNIGDVLALPPLLMEKYLNAAEKITEAAIVANVTADLPRQRFESEKLQTKGEVRPSRRDRRILVLSAEGEVSAKVDFPKAGEYYLRARAGARQAGTETAKMELRLDGKKIDSFEVQAPSDAPQVYEKRLRVEQGTHLFEAVFLNHFFDEKETDRSKQERSLYVTGLEVEGPTDAYLDGLPESHKRIVISRPRSGRSVREHAREVLSKFASRAFRRPATNDEVDRLVSLVDKIVQQQGETFERGIQIAVQAVLVSPHFLFRLEKDATPDDSKAPHALGDYELASRLSYFLWSSLPDDDLFALAAKGELHQPPVLEAQVRRMLQDRKSQALVENFASQWLQLRSLEEVAPDPQQFPTVDDKLKADMARETKLFFDAIVREDRSLGDFLDGKFTFVNERLAGHYGLPDVKGDEFRKVHLPEGGPRAGILTQASILTLTSNPTRTSPVKRGKWILETILGAPPPPPPPDVPELEQTAKAAPNASLREQLEIHRRNESCAVCHRQMDAIGFGFENFDAVGRWRERDGKFPIDSSGTLPGGGKFRGRAELVQILKKRRAEFSRCLTEKLLTYALGRGLEFYDRCTVDRIVETLTQKNDRFSTLVIQIVHSEPFRLRRGEGEKE